MYGFLTRMARDCVGDLTICVPDHGMAHADVAINGSVTNPARTSYLFAHLQATRRAMADGANAKVIFHWPLLDNYEWALGHEKRFGLVHVDFESLQRVPKSSYYALSRAVAR